MASHRLHALRGGSRHWRHALRGVLAIGDTHRVEPLTSRIAWRFLPGTRVVSQTASRILAVNVAQCAVLAIGVTRCVEMSRIAWKRHALRGNVRGWRPTRGSCAPTSRHSSVDSSRGEFSSWLTSRTRTSGGLRRCPDDLRRALLAWSSRRRLVEVPDGVPWASHMLPRVVIPGASHAWSSRHWRHASRGAIDVTHRVEVDGGTHRVEPLTSRVAWRCPPGPRVVSQTASRILAVNVAQCAVLAIGVTHCVEMSAAGVPPAALALRRHGIQAWTHPVVSSRRGSHLARGHPEGSAAVPTTCVGSCLRGVLTAGVSRRFPDGVHAMRGVFSLGLHTYCVESRHWRHALRGVSPLASRIAWGLAIGVTPRVDHWRHALRGFSRNRRVTLVEFLRSERIRSYTGPWGGLAVDATRIAAGLLVPVACPDTATAHA
jgi:hypothetical protein